MRSKGRGNWMKAVEKYEIPVISTRDVMYNMINIMNTAVCYAEKLLRK